MSLRGARATSGQLFDANAAVGPQAANALQLCPRSVVVDSGMAAADGETRTMLADAALLARHRLELPYGFDRRLLEVDGLDATRLA